MVFEILEQISHFGLDLIERSGYMGVFIISFLENVLTPIPSEAVIPFAGVLASQGRFDVLSVIVSATFGSVAGAYVFYALGYALGSERFRQLIVKYGKYIFISEQDLDRAEHWFEKYDAWAVLVCRVIPLVRSFISIPAGYVKMPVFKFTILTGIGTAVWSTFLVYLGVVLGNSYQEIIPLFRKLDVVVAGVIGIVVVWFLYKKLQNRKNVTTDKVEETQQQSL